MRVSFLSVDRTTLRRTWWVLLLCGALGLAGGAIATVVTPPQYSASVFLRVDASTLDGGFKRVVRPFEQTAISATILNELRQDLDLGLTVQQLRRQIVARDVYAQPRLRVSVTEADRTSALAIAQRLAALLVTHADRWTIRPTVTVVREPKVEASEGPITPQADHLLPIGIFIGLSAGVVAIVTFSARSRRTRSSRERA